MQPSFDMRIRTMKKALEETIIPGIAVENRAALEQAHLVVGSLELLRQQIDYANWLEIVDARSMAALAHAILAEAAFASSERAAAACAAALAEAERHERPLSRLASANRELRAAISALVDEAFAMADASVAERVQAHVLKASGPQILRERAFVAAANFDVFPDNLVPLEDALTQGSDR